MTQLPRYSRLKFYFWAININVIYFESELLQEILQLN